MNNQFKIGNKIKFITKLNKIELEGIIVSYDYKNKKFKIDLGIGSMLIKQQDLIIKEIIL